LNIDLKAAGAYLESLICHPASPEEVKSGERLGYHWDKTLPYSSGKYARILEKDPNRDFVILNLTDIQCHDFEAFNQVGDFYEETIDKLIKKVNPDLITTTGDNAFDPFAWLKLIEFLDSYGIPWAPVMGNADHRGLVSEFWAAYRMSHAKNCLFECGPDGMGYGNYILHIRQNGKTIHSLYMMDTWHEDTFMDGSWDHLTKEQIEWYSWAVKGLETEEGRKTESSVLMHIPVPEYQNAWDEASDEQKFQPFQKMNEPNGAPLFQNGFFETCKKLGSTKTMLCGHDHKNCFSINYHGINLIYSMKTGYGCYWERETNGGTTLILDAEGHARVDQHYIDPGESEVKAFMLEYYGKDLYEKRLKD